MAPMNFDGDREGNPMNMASENPDPKEPKTDEPIETATLKTIRERSKTYLRTYGWLPTATVDDVKKFFSEEQGFKINQVFLHDLRGYSRGACYIEFASEDDVISGLKKNRDRIGERFIKVSRTDPWVLERLLRHLRKSAKIDGNFVQLVGLCRDVEKEDVVNFFGENMVENAFFGKDRGRNDVLVKLTKVLENGEMVKMLYKTLGEKFVQIHRMTGVEFQRRAKKAEGLELLTKLQAEDWPAIKDKLMKLIRYIEDWAIQIKDYRIQNYLKGVCNYLQLFDERDQRYEKVVNILLKDGHSLRQALRHAKRVNNRANKHLFN